MLWKCLDLEQKQCEEEKSYWKKILKIVVSVIKFLTSQGLPFRGKSDKFDTTDNGNYLENLISKHNSFLKEHISNYGNSGRGHINYLSKTVCDELVEIMVKKLLFLIISEIKIAKCYFISVDSMPDINHKDQLTFILRYVKEGRAIERFLEFIPITCHEGEYLSNIVLSIFNKFNISVSDYRGLQSYDNAANMSSSYKGLQAKLKEYSPTAVYVPCAAHSLNLVGVHAVSCNTEIISYFDFLQKIYTFFSASTYRWNILNSQNLIKVLKILSATQWSTRTDAFSFTRKI